MLPRADWCAVRSALLLGGSRLAEAEFGGEGAALARVFDPRVSPKRCSGKSLARDAGKVSRGKRGCPRCPLFVDPH